MYATAQVSMINAVGGGQKSSSAKTNKADSGFADVLAQKTDSQSNNKAETNTPVENSNKQNNATENTQKDQAADQKDPQQNMDTKNATDDGQELTSQEEAIALSTQILLVAPPVVTVTEQPEETAVVNNAAQAGLVVTPTTKNISEEKTPTAKTPLLSAGDNDAAQQQNLAEKSTGNNNTNALAPIADNQKQATAQTTQDRPLEAVVVAPDGDEAEVKPEQPVQQNMMAAQNPDNTIPEDLEVRIPVSDSSSLLQRQTTQQLSDRIISQFKEGAQQFTLDLHPERLGHVKVSMLFESGQLVIKVETHSQLAQNLLAGGLAELKNTLTANGVQVGDVEISPYADQRQNEQESSKHSNADQQGQRHVDIQNDESYMEEAVEAAMAENVLDYMV